MDTYVLVAVAAAVTAIGALVLRARPRLAAVAWMVVLAFVPFWLTLPVIVPLPPQTAAAVVIVLALTGTVGLRLVAADAVVAVVVVIAGLGYLVGAGTVHTLVVAALDWAACYLLGRLLATRLDAEWLFGAIAVVLAAAGLLAVVEFATGFNLFIALRSPWGGDASTWTTLQGRGGILRAEGAFGHSIALGACLAMAVPMALSSRLPQWLRICVVAALGAGAVVTFSRIGIACAVLGAVGCLALQRTHLSRRARVILSALLLGAAAVALPLVSRVFSEAGAEASNSAEYRLQILSLVPNMRFLGLSGTRDLLVDGTRSVATFGSVDSAVLVTGLTYGVLAALLLLGLHLSSVLALRRPEPSGALIAVAAQLPAVLTVALITQYSMFFWFVAGLAVTTSDPRALRGVTRVAQRGAAKAGPRMSPQAASAPGEQALHPVVRSEAL